MSGIDEGREEVPRLLSFSGKAQDWRMWSRKFIARASMKHYVDVLLGIEEVPEMVAVNVIESAEELKIREARLEAYKKANDLGHAELMNAMNEEVSFSIVDEAILAMFPWGDLAKAWKGLQDMYQPSIAATKVTLKRE